MVEDDHEAAEAALKSMLGACLVQQDRLDEAEPLLRESIATLEGTHGEGRWRTQFACEALVALEAARGGV